MLTGERIIKMPISLAILKEIKETYGEAERVSADTSYGFECDSIWFYGIKANREQLREIANKHRTSEMINSDGEIDACDVTVMPDVTHVELLDDITEFYKEL